MLGGDLQPWVLTSRGDYPTQEGDLTGARTILARRPGTDPQGLKPQFVPLRAPLSARWDAGRFCGFGFFGKIINYVRLADSCC